MTRHADLSIAVACAVVTVASPALAGARCGSGHRKLHRLDLNGDGRVSCAESEALKVVRFLRWDAGRDGAFTREEIASEMKAPAVARGTKEFATMDRNGDVRIDRAEFGDLGSERFARSDADGDGPVADSELRARWPVRHHARDERWREHWLAVH